MAGENGKIKQTCSAMGPRYFWLFPARESRDQRHLNYKKTTGSLAVLLGLYRHCPYAIAAPRATCPRHIGHAALF